jgi:hypothetical protein
MVYNQVASEVVKLKKTMGITFYFENDQEIKVKRRLMVTELEYAKEKKVFIIQKKDGERLKLS